MEENKDNQAKTRNYFQKGGLNLLVLGVLSVMIALLTTSISLAIYHNSGDIYLDRSRPGYMPDEQEIENNDGQNLDYELNKSGKMTMEVLEEYLENLNRDIKAIDAYGDTFEQGALSDEQLGLPRE